MLLDSDPESISTTDCWHRDLSKNTRILAESVKAHREFMFNIILRSSVATKKQIVIEGASTGAFESKLR
ncbi:hypothetical protein KIN20_005303 [Parelaphostrongylus tenuis]|uniref:Uncharacterized protein n=1 Tax=Parelaphostrongylus tenuis TaxID=148309 RepID=A0AAD5MIN3_PARTN|nr:hypothetical protein KIN20_005303 [Parelaphostrongylus tenuis]